MPLAFKNWNSVEAERGSGRKGDGEVCFIGRSRYFGFNKFWFTEAVIRGVLWKKVFLEILENSQENTCPRVSFLIKLQASGLRTLFLQNTSGDCFMWATASNFFHFCVAFNFTQIHEIYTADIQRHMLECSRCFEWYHQSKSLTQSSMILIQYIIVNYASFGTRKKSKTKRD